MKKWVVSLVVAGLLAGVGWTLVSAEGTFVTLPKEKKEILERKAQNMNRARNDYISKKDGLDGPLVVQHDVNVKAKILDRVEDPINEQDYLFTNGWVGPMNGNILVIEAGSLLEDKAQGILIVRTDNEKRKFVGEKKYGTPGKHGAVTILGVKEEDLTLQAEDGTVWKFNVPSGNFKEI